MYVEEDEWQDIIFLNSKVKHASQKDNETACKLIELENSSTDILQ